MRSHSSSVKLLKGKNMSFMKNSYPIIVFKGPENLTCSRGFYIYVCMNMYYKKRSDILVFDYF